MGSSLLTLVQRAAREMGLPVPAAVAGATDQQTQQLFGLANAVGDDLLSRGEWVALQTQAIINVEAPITTTGTVTEGSQGITDIPADLLGLNPTVYVVSGNGIQVASRVTEITVNMPGDDSLTMDMQATASGSGVDIVIARDTYPVPSDFQTFIDRTQWDRTNHWELRGPMSPQEAQWVMSGIVTTGPRRRFRQVGRGSDVFRIWPPPTAQDAPATFAYEYVSAYWAQDAAGTPQSGFVLDTDTCVFDDRVMIAGIKYNFFAVKGFDATRFERDYNVLIQTSMGSDGGAQTLDMARRRWPIFISPASTPDGFFPGPGNP